MSIKQCLAFARDCFLSSSKDINSTVDKHDAKVDSEVLLCDVLGKAKSYLLTWPDNVLSEQQYQTFLDYVARRKRGEPVAYILGTQEFWSLSFKVADCTLIPRADTETLVEAVLNNHPQQQGTLLDLGTGTGAIALALAHEKPHWRVDAVDYHHDAVNLAKQNRERLSLQHVAIYQSDWFSQVAVEKRFDVIVSNPPYIDEHDPHLSQGDVRFEPLSALVAKDNGFRDIQHIINTARDYLNSGGALYLEHGFEQHQGVQALLKEHGFQKIHTYYDYGGNPRITMGVYQ
ncbi:peptide chain release factor N(5)-glutamine methyltransferase [Thalassotalea sp. HSM 43]|nr:peptide chain release factor N(5)-glutamine methyltransferase [Thalassotalea sp. HSM 43]